MKAFISGIVLTLLLLALGGYAFISAGYFPANADGKPPAIEKWMARKSLHATISREAPALVPIPANDENLAAGAKLYTVNCAVCHGASDGKPSNIAKGLYQHAPQLAKHGVDDDPEGETYWKIKHGIRLTGMPAFSATLSDNEIWQVTLFLKHLPALSPLASQAWLAIPSAGQ